MSEKQTEEVAQIKFDVHELAEVMKELVKVVNYIFECLKNGEVQISASDTIDDLARKPYIKNSENAGKFPTRGETFNQPSKTIPDQSLSVQQIMARYAKGLPVEGQTKNPVFDEENPIPDFNRMDIAEKEELKNATQQEIRDISYKHKQVLADQERLRKMPNTLKTLNKKDEDINPAK